MTVGNVPVLLGSWVCQAGGRVLLVVAPNEYAANLLIGMQLEKLGLFDPNESYTLVPVGLGRPHVLNLGPVD